MKLIKLNIVGLSYSQFKSGAYALFLEEDNGLRKLSIVIGACEAQAIAIGLDKNIISPRPLTHDLFLTIAKNANLILDKIIIHKLEKGIFFSSVVFVDTKTNKKFNIDARTSDAIALALRFDSPIYTYDKILDKAGIILKKEIKEKKEKKFDESFKGYNIKQLNKKISKAIEDEDYELAAKLRDEINQRK